MGNKAVSSSAFTAFGTKSPTSLAPWSAAGLQFRNEMEVGPGGKQIQLQDPDGNPIELFEPAR